LPTVSARQAVNLPEGGSATVDFPFTMRRTLEGSVFLDRNRNGIRDEGDGGVGNIPMCLDGRRVIATDLVGRYEFPEVEPGPHEVVLNCGMPLPDLVLLSEPRVRIMLGGDQPQRVEVDFRAAPQPDPELTDDGGVADSTSDAPDDNPAL